MENRINVKNEILETMAPKLSKIERYMLNTLLAGLESLNPMLSYEILISDDDPEEVGINIYENEKFLAEVYCAQVIGGLTGEYQVSTPTDEGGPKILLLDAAASRITKPPRAL